MTESASGAQWGDWVLGDVVDTMRFVGSLLGPAQQVVSVQVTLPAAEDGSEGLPLVQVTARGALQNMRLRRAVVKGEYEARFIGQPTDTYCSAIVGGVHLVLAVGEGS